MIRTERERATLIDAFLDEGPRDLSPRVRDAVLATLRVTRQRGSGFPMGWRLGLSRRPLPLGTGALVAAVVAIGLIGGLGRPGAGPGGSSGAPATTEPTSERTRDAAMSPTTAAPSPTVVPYRGLGYIGFPPLDAPPGESSVTTLVATYRQPRLPYHGSAYVFADGRMIWIEYLGQPGTFESTGYLEQRLTEEGIDLVADAASDPIGGFARLAPASLVDTLPAEAWVDPTIRPYVPPGYGICLTVADGRPPRATNAHHPPTGILAQLPADVARILARRPTVPSTSYDSDFECLGLPMADARALDAAFRDAGFEQESWHADYLVSYSIDLDGDGPQDQWLQVFFEPILPDGSVECTGCG